MKSALLLAVLFSLVAVARASVTETFTHSYHVNPDVAIRLENINGDIDITAWDKPDVSLVAEKRAKDDEELNRLEIIIDADPSRLSIKTKHTKKTGWFFHNWNSASVRYKLMVPVTARLEKIDSVNSDIVVTGVHGDINLETVNGGVEARGVARNARLESVNGSVRLEFDATDKVSEVRLSSVNGRVEVTLPKGASASVRTSSVNGSTRVDQPIRLSKSGRHSLSGEIGNGGGPTIAAETVNGGISIREK